jgi:UDP-N-acetylglucosamine 2-epimerase (non-hydrolysing)
MHPNPSVQKTVKEVLGSNPNVFLVEAMGYIEFAHALANATLAITDSGGIQEEAPSVGTPVLVARDETERQEGVEAGTLLLVGSDPAVIAGAALDLLNNEDRLAEMRDAWNPFGDGQAATRIRELVEYLVEGGAPPSPFGTGVSRIAVLKAAGYLVPTHASNLAEEGRLHEYADHEPDDAHLPLA